MLSDAVGERGVSGEGTGDRGVQPEPLVEVPAGAHLEGAGAGQGVEDTDAHRRGEREPAADRVQPRLDRGLRAGVGTAGRESQEGHQPGDGEHSNGGHVARQAGP
jgi:hypothetical protein